METTLNTLLMVGHFANVFISYKVVSDSSPSGFLFHPSGQSWGGLSRKKKTDGQTEKADRQTEIKRKRQRQTDRQRQR